MKHLNNRLKLVISIAVPLLAGFVGSIFTMPSIPGWYADLFKPALNPPSWIFGPVWTTLFVLIGIAAFLVWKKGFEKKGVRIALSVFLFQLVLNTLWSIIFFGLHNPGWALVDIALLWLAIVAAIIAFARVSRPAAWLLLPYIMWVSFASYLNYQIYVLNPVASVVELRDPFVIRYYSADYKNLEYAVEGFRVMLDDLSTIDGRTTTFFGNELFSDLNGDGHDDVTFIITRSGAGSGTFFYVVSALNTGRGYAGSSAFLLGDRIAPQSTNKSADGAAGVIVVNYADRAANEPFTTKPSVGKSIRLILDPVTMKLGIAPTGLIK
jgi:tryptophan-rich sensory protein